MTKFNMMKGLIILLVTASLSVFTSRLAAQDDINSLNVLEIYEILPERMFNIDEYLGNIKYELTYNNGKYSVVSLAGYNFDATVDIKNGYIEISDEGTGGGSIYQQIVLFRTANRSPLIGITIGGFNSFYFDTRLNFYRYINNTWQDVTYEVLPEIETEQFVNKEFYKLNRKKFAENSNFFDYIFELPHYGTQLQVDINLLKINSLLYDKIDIQNGKELTESQIDFLIDFIGNIKYEKLKMDFDRSGVKFNISEHVPVSQEALEDILFAYIETLDNGETYDLESELITKLYDLPEMTALGNYIDENSNHRNHLKIIPSGTPEENDGYYYFKAAEDNGGNLVTLIHFFINAETYEISIYDPVMDKMISYDKWKNDFDINNDN